MSAKASRALAVTGRVRTATSVGKDSHIYGDVHAYGPTSPEYTSRHAYNIPEETILPRGARGGVYLGTCRSSSSYNP